MKFNTSFTIITLISLFAVSSSDVISDKSKFNSFLRNINHERLLKSEVTTGQSYKCKSFINNTCTCFKPCMVPKEGTEDCTVKKCYKYDSNLDQCQEDGQSQTAAILMQIFLGFFGGGVGFIHNWFWFGIWWGMFGGALLIICTLLCCFIQEEKGDGSGIACCYQCITCLFSCILLGFWVYFLVMICNKEFLDKNGCKLV